MTRTNDDVPLDCTTSQQTTIMGANVVDRVELAVNVEHSNQRVIDFDLCIVARRNGGEGSDGEPS
jgi:hypothetical protein